MIRSLFSSWQAPLVLAGLIAAVVLVLPAQVSAQAADTGRVRVMHASPDAPPVDIFVDGQKAVTALAFPKDTGYVSLPAGARNVKVFVSPSTGSGTPVLEANLTVVKGKDYTVLAVGEVGKNTLALLPLEDNNATPATGKAHIRLIHASPDAPAVNVAVAGTQTNVFANVAFKGVGAYTPVDAGTYNLEVRVAASGAVAKAIPGLELKARTVYSAVAVGLAGNNTLQVVALLDAAAPAPSAPHTGTGLAAVTDPANSLFIVLGAIALIIGAGALLAPATMRRPRSW
ncbi:MAG: DUF4397 domain-containing protein [Dehalococcoidia bacterium]